MRLCCSLISNTTRFPALQPNDLPLLVPPDYDGSEYLVTLGGNGKPLGVKFLPNVTIMEDTVDGDRCGRKRAASC